VWTGTGRQGTPDDCPGEAPGSGYVARGRPLHPSPLDPIATRLRPASWFGAGALAALAAGLATLATPLAGDAALGVVGLVALAGSGALAFRGHQLQLLPLEIAERALGGEIDAVPVVRFRVRLGLGRPFRDATARVWFVGERGEHELEVLVPSGALVGPLTLVARDPARVTTGPGRLRVQVSVTSAGAAWAASRELACPVQAGRFGGVQVGPGGVDWSPGWAEAEPATAGTAC
jgi:hypothetical protein